MCNTSGDSDGRDRDCRDDSRTTEENLKAEVYRGGVVDER